jgi:hypothetical protein
MIYIRMRENNERILKPRKEASSAPCRTRVDKTERNGVGWTSWRMLI